MTLHSLRSCKDSEGRCVNEQLLFNIVFFFHFLHMFGVELWGPLWVCEVAATAVFWMSLGSTPFQAARVTSTIDGHHDGRLVVISSLICLYTCTENRAKDKRYRGKGTESDLGSVFCWRGYGPQGGEKMAIFTFWLSTREWYAMVSGPKTQKGINGSTRFLRNLNDVGKFMSVNKNE